MDINNFQRIGAPSNAHVGSDFEPVALEFFKKQGVILTRNFPLEVGVQDLKKVRKFDLGSDSPPIVVECKSSKWTQGAMYQARK